MITRKTWMFASALLLTTACSDDDKPTDETRDGGQDAATRDAAVGTLDGGADASSIDAALQDANTPADAAADATAGDANVPAQLAVIGVWREDSDYGPSEHVITATKWDSQTIIEYDNATRTVYGQYPADDMYSPSKYTKLVWTAVTSDGFYQCVQEYGADTLAAAKATSMLADPNNLTTGCGGGFPWSRYAPTIELNGAWKSNGNDFAIDSLTFGDYAIESYDNAANKGVLSSGADAAKTYNKIVWTVASTTSASYCILATDFTSAADAAASTETADSTMPTTGCNGGPFSSLTK